MNKSYQLNHPRQVSMRNYLYIVFLLIGISGYTQMPNQSSLLWKISGKGLSTPSYIFGTFHLMCKEQFKISQSLEETLFATKQFYGELDMDDPQMQLKMMQEMMMTGKPLSSYLSAEEYAKLKAGFQKITGMDISKFDQYKPFFSLSFLLLKTVTCPIVIQPETELVQLAKQKQMEVLGLETIEEQIAAINMEPIDSQIVAIQQIVSNFDSSKNVMKEMTSIYLKNDADALYDYMKQHNTNDNFETALLINRNQKWVPKMKIIMENKASFFAIGAGHLGGKNGILALLRTEGYQVDPIKY
jgi:uncharacterized protein YbaP (TraB family)